MEDRTEPAPRFVDARDVLPAARRILERERRRIAPLIPGAILSLTGASSHADMVTAGDVDLHLRVPRHRFAAAVERLRLVYAIARPDIWSDGFAVLAVADAPAGPPTGIAVTAIGGEHDRRFRRAWALLAADDRLRARLNALKRAHDGRGSVDDPSAGAAYLAAKATFFEDLDAEARRRRLPDNPPMRPFEFLADGRAPASYREIAEAARRAEATGFTALVVPDHLIEQLAPVPAMAAIAAATSTLRVSSFVLNNDLRHPAVLAQDLASLDLLSDGRLDVAVGAGWNEPEYRAIGLPFEPVATRVGRLTEAVAVLKGCFGDGPFSFAGAHYTITDYDGHPKPVQRPYPPFLIGGGGRRTLELAAREADIVGLAPRILPGRRPDPRSLTWAATEEKIAWVHEAAGERFDDLRFNVYPSTWPVTVTDDLHGEARRVIDSLRERTGIELTEQEVIDSPHLFIGSLGRFEEKFSELRERLGVSSFMVGEPDALAPVVTRLTGS